MFDILKDFEMEDIIKGSMMVHDIVLEKIMTKKYVFMIGNKHELLACIDCFDLEVEPLQINGDNILKLRSDKGGFVHTFFVKKDENLRNAIDSHGCENPKKMKINFDLLIGFELDEMNLNYLTVKKDEDFTIKNVDRLLNIVFPIADAEDIATFNRRTNEVIHAEKQKLKKLKVGNN